MAAPLEARQKQRAVIEFLVAEGETPLRIHNRLKNVYMDNSIDYSNVKRWVQRFKKSTEDHEEVGKVSIADKPRSGRPSTSVNPDNKTYADELIRTDRRITVEELASKLDVSIGSAHSIVASLGYFSVCPLGTQTARRRRRRLKGIHSRPDTNRTGAEGLSSYYPRLLYCLDQMLAVMLLSQHRVSSSKTVRPRAPCGARCMGHIVSTWSAVCSEAPHSQFGEGARPHLCMDEWNRPTPVRRRLSLTQAARGNPIPTGLTLVPGTNARSLEALSQYSAFHL